MDLRNRVVGPEEAPPGPLPNNKLRLVLLAESAVFLGTSMGNLHIAKRTESNNFQALRKTWYPLAKNVLIWTKM
jgi:hypothetical protein